MRTVPMNLLFDDIEVIESVGDPSTVEVGGISHDSRRVVPGDLFCCVPGHSQRRPRVRRRGGRAGCRRTPVRALHPRPARARRRADPGRARHDASRHGPAGCRLLRAPGTGSLDDRRDGHERQDHRDAAPRRPSHRDRPAHQRHGHALGSPDDPRGDRDPTGPGGRARPPEVGRCAAMRWPWRCPATPSSSHGSRASTSTSACSPTSATTISITTGRWRTTSRRKPCCSPRGTRCAASSMRTIRGASDSSNAPASRWWPSTVRTPPTSCWSRATPSSPGAASGSRLP